MTIFQAEHVVETGPVFLSYLKFEAVEENDVEFVEDDGDEDYDEDDYDDDEDISDAYYDIDDEDYNYNDDIYDYIGDTDVVVIDSGIGLIHYIGMGISAALGMVSFF